MILRLSVDQEPPTVVVFFSVSPLGRLCCQQLLSLSLSIFVCRLVVDSLFVFHVIAVQLGRQGVRGGLLRADMHGLGPGQPVAPAAQRALV